MSLPPTFQFHTSLSRFHLHNSPSRFHLLLYRHKSNKIFTPTTNAPTWLHSWSSHSPSRPKAVADYRHSTSDNDDDTVGTSRSTSSSTMDKIVQKLKHFGYIDTVPTPTPSLPSKGSVEDIFYSEDGVLPNATGGLSDNVEQEARFPWEKRELEESERRRKASKSSIAELTLPEGELRRLRHLAIRMKSKTRIKGAGVTKEVVDLIHEKWRTEEVVRLKVEGPPALNMKRMHEILERRTGGLVIWRSGTSVSLYRGVSYGTPQPEKKLYQSIQTAKVGSVGSVREDAYNPARFSTEYDRGNNAQYHHEGPSDPVEKREDAESPRDIIYETEVDRLLDSLGPRYTDWPGSDPLPVDADMLPGFVPGYQPPFRILPYGVRRSLGYKEGTALRRLARVLPPHFALGRSRQHLGLAAAIVKLWEKSSIAKIGLKRGVQLTTSERMAEDIKKLTGGSILSRNKDYIVFYRGKDFLSPEVTEALVERERLATSLQDEEEQARLRASSSVFQSILSIEEPGRTGTLGETLEADAKWGSRLDDDHKNKMTKAAELSRHAGLVRKLERKLLLAECKLSKAERALSKVEAYLKPVDRVADPDSITDEERFMFRKLGLRMKAFLLLGRRGVFDGTVENMHLHWKYRELVKVIVKAKTFGQVRSVALALEAESGGVLVSVDKISKGFAVVVYRGKDYKRPSAIRPKNLLTKRKALARSIELQRHEALSAHISNLHKKVEKLRSELGKMEDAVEQGDEDLYSKLESTYSTEDEGIEDEGDEAYLETFDSSVDVGSDEDVEADNYNNAGRGNSDEDDEAGHYEDDSEDEMINDLPRQPISCYSATSRENETLSDPTEVCK